ncbi:MAG: SLC13 family permease [Pseudomonadaceae bacterium]|nr:SLC13 family permease [Pseudomonadaceae bacterium]
MESLPILTTDMALVLALVGLAVFLFATELLRVDVAAILIMTLLGLLIYVPGLESLLAPELLFSGLSSNAVVSIIAVMILGGGLDKTGVMDRLAFAILSIGGRTRPRITSLVSGTVAGISAFMQNVGAAALFLPVVARVSSRTGIAMSQLVMPMGFCAILGGTLTMVASSPLIMLNDLIANANELVEPEQTMATFSLFSVLPVGLALVATGLIYFLLFGPSLLKPRPDELGQRSKGRGTVRYLRRIHGIDAAVREVEVPVGSPFVGLDIEGLQNEYDVKIVASRYANKVLVSPPTAAPIAAPATLAVIADRQHLRRFVASGQLTLRGKLREFRHLLARSIAGIAEIVVPPDSSLVGKTPRELRLRQSYGLSLLSVFRAGKALTDDLPDSPLQGGDTLICHTRWDLLADLERNRDFVVVTSDYPRESRHPYKVALALSFFALSLFLVLFTNIMLPVALLTGAVGMIVSGVLSMDEAYRAVSWKTVFLLAGLLPLGNAVANSGAATYLAVHLLDVLPNLPDWGLQAVVAVLATCFTLVMSNVGATVLLVPIAIKLALASGADPALFALTVAISTSNSFLLPTHQVNALIMGPGGYSVRDFFRVGSIMTVLFLIVSLSALNLLFG